MTIKSTTSTISVPVVVDDAAGFPIVRWSERRGMFASAANETVVECRIMKDSRTGQLLFVARGPVRHGAYEEGLPWERLRGFSMQTAEALYTSRSEASRRHHLAAKGLASRWLWSDPAHVLVAEFGGPVIHINHVDTARVELETLQRVLEVHFIDQADDLASKLCEWKYRWPTNDARVETYDPGTSVQGNAEAEDTFGPLGNVVFATLTGLIVLAIGYVGFSLVRPWLL